MNRDRHRATAHNRHMAPSWQPPMMDQPDDIAVSVQPASASAQPSEDAVPDTDDYAPLLGMVDRLAQAATSR
jgi:hypothetical protein